MDSFRFALRGVDIGSQSMVSTLGNTIAYAARAVLSTAIGVAFIQLLWLKLRRRRYPVAHLDALVACKGAPFAMSALPTWRFAFLLAITASTASLMAFISIVVPGSLRITSSDVTFECNVPTVSLGASNIAQVNISSTNNVEFLGSKPLLLKIASRVLMLGGTLPPLNNSSSSDSYRYTVSFHAPVANCTPFELGMHLSATLPANTPNDESTLWNVTSASNSPEDFKFIAAARNLTDNSASAVTCDTYNGTYTVAVSHSSTAPSTAHIIETLWKGPINASQTVNNQYYAVSVAFRNILLGVIQVNTKKDDGIRFGDNAFVGFSPAFSGTSTGPWSPTGDLATSISSFMQNISVSLLSEQLLEMGGLTTGVNTTCWKAASIYEYNRIQLFATYGSALGVTAICVFFGFWAVRQNGVEESFSFSRIVGAILNKSLFADRHQLNEWSQLTADGRKGGQLRLVHTTLS